MFIIARLVRNKISVFSPTDMGATRIENAPSSEANAEHSWEQDVHSKRRQHAAADEVV